MGSGGELVCPFRGGGLCAVLSLSCTSFGVHCETYEWISLKRLGESTVEWLAMIVTSMALLRIQAFMKSRCLPCHHSIRRFLENVRHAHSESNARRKRPVTSWMYPVVSSDLSNEDLE